jgi:hypothetical protein
MTEETKGTTEEPVSPSTGLKKESIWEVYYPTGVNEDKDAVPVASFPMIIYFWPTIIAMFTCGVTQSFMEAESTTVGWWGVGVLCFNLMVIVTDLDQKKFLITILLLVAAGLGLWITNLKDLGIVSGLSQWLSSIDVSMSTDAYFVILSMLCVFFVLGMAQPRFNYWRFEPNEFIHYIQPWGRDQSIPRVGSTVAREVPDMLELILTFGGGTLVVRREGQVVARIQHVPFLGKRMIAIERMLGVTRVRDVGD